MFIRMRNLLSGLIIGIALASCGGGGGSQVAEGGIGGTGISTGTVTGFGSIIVNDVHFDTTGAVVMKDDDDPIENMNDADIDQLISIGMVVTVKGEINDDGVTGTAETITYEDILEGPVVGTPGTSSFNVLGQIVNVVDGVTQYRCDESYITCDLTDITDLSDGQIVEISGFIDEKGDIVAGYIEKQDEGYVIGVDSFEIKGTATYVNSTALTINGLTIITADATPYGGEFIEAKGTFNGTDTLTAIEVEIEDEGYDIEDADKAELEGIAQTGCVATDCDFTLTGVTVKVGSNTQYNTGSAINITAGDKLEAEGSLQGGILFADEIEFK